MASAATQTKIIPARGAGAAGGKARKETVNKNENRFTNFGLSAIDGTPAHGTPAHANQESTDMLFIWCKQVSALSTSDPT